MTDQAKRKGQEYNQIKLLQFTLFENFVLLKVILILYRLNKL